MIVNACLFDLNKQTKRGHWLDCLHRVAETHFALKVILTPLCLLCNWCDNVASTYYR